MLKNIFSGNRVAVALTVLAVLEIAAGFILGLVLGIDWLEWGIFFECFGVGLAVGIPTLGIAEIIKLLQRIADKG